MPTVPAGSTRGAVWRSARRPARLLAVMAASFAAVTCDLVTNPASESTLQMQYVGDSVLVVGSTVDFVPVVTDGGVPVAGLRFRVTSTNSDVVEIQGNEFTPRLFVKARGRATVQASLIGSTLGANPPGIGVPITAVVQALSSDSAALSFFSLNDTIRLAATASDANAQTISGAGASARWSSTNAAVAAVDSITGRVTATGNGTAQVIVCALA